MELKSVITKPAYELAELCKGLVPFGRTSIYEDIRLGKLRAVKRGSRTIVLADDLVAYLNRLRDESPLPSVKTANLNRRSDVIRTADASQRDDAPAVPLHRGINSEPPSDRRRRHRPLSAQGMKEGV